MRRFCLLVIVVFVFLIPSKSFGNDIYAISVYHFKDAQQEISIDTYLQTALLPALHRAQKINIGVFKPIDNDTASDKKIYLIIPYKSFDEIIAIQRLLALDMVYNEAGKQYLTSSYQNPAYTRMETILLNAFDKAPYMNRPHLSGDKKEHIYELRSYESATENYHASKVKMFNAGGETNIFSRLHFNAVFYGDVIAGSHMPNLMYLTCFANREDRDAHWKSFTDDEEVKKLFTRDEYKNNVSKADIILMHATSYSDY